MVSSVFIWGWMMGLEELNATVRWTVARCGLDRIDTFIFFCGAKENANESLIHPSVRGCIPWGCRHRPILTFYHPKRPAGGESFPFRTHPVGMWAERKHPIHRTPFREAELFLYGVDDGTRKTKCSSPGFHTDILTGKKCTIYLLSIYRDSLRCSSIYHGSHCRFESHDRRNLSAKQKNPLSLK